jgi:hypothetical protein
MDLLKMRRGIGINAELCTAACSGGSGGHHPPLIVALFNANVSQNRILVGKTAHGALLA